MKQRISFIGLLGLILMSFIFCTGHVKEHQKVSGIMPPGTTLDTLQGVWKNEDDTANVITVSGRYWNDSYPSSTSPINETYRLYFSDTAVTADDFTLANFDTTALTGAYVIRVLQSDNSMDCMEISNLKRLNGDMFLSIHPPGHWTMNSIVTYKKTN